jgi:hypothetical protein
MRMLSLILLLFMLSTECSAKNNKHVNPTGTYKLMGTCKGGIKPNGAKWRCRVGELRVKRLGRSRVAISYYGDNGEPGYHVAQFIDTVFYNGNSAWSNPYGLDSCRIVIIFGRTAATILQDDYYCGFGYGAKARGTYEKVSDRIPKIESFEISIAPKVH